MAWEFSTDPATQAQLDWARRLVDDELIPLESITYHLDHARLQRLLVPFKARVKEAGLWAAHLPPEHGGQGAGQLKLALLHEILGRCDLGPEVFGCQPPDSGNAELLAAGADEAQRQRWLYPLMAGEIRSAFCLTEPHNPGSDPTEITTRCERDGDSWVLSGHKWFSSNASIADILIVMAVTDPSAPPHRRASMLVVPVNTPGVVRVRDVPTMHHPDIEGNDALMNRAGGHTEVRFEQCRVPLDHMVGQPGDGFILAQKRLGGGRIHHGMRMLAQCHRAFEMLLERAASRQNRGKPLGAMQMVQEAVAESHLEIEMARLLTLRAAWEMDRDHHSPATRRMIAMVKLQLPRVLMGVLDRAIQLHGALGYSCDMPLEYMYRAARALRIADGADDLHKQTIARDLLKGVTPVQGWPSEHMPTRRARAIERFGHLLNDL